MTYRRKFLFWMVLAAALAFLAVPTVVLIENVQSYWRMFSPPRLLKPGLTSSVPHRGEAPADETAPQFVRFRIRAPKAKTVHLAGDFNLWSKDTLAMKKRRDGDWELLLPLPPGAYGYLFSVDGKWTLDSKNPERRTVNGVETSVRRVP